MSTMGTGNFGEFLWPGIRKQWGDSFKEWKECYTKFANVTSSDKAFEKYQGATGFGLASVKNQSDSVAYVNSNLGFQRQITNVVYAMGAQVSRELYDDDQYGYINKIPKFLARSLRETMEVTTHDLLNNGFGSVLTADGTAFFATTHPLIDAGAATLSNTPAVPADLTQTSLEDAGIAISNFVDDKGLKQNLRGTKIIVPTASQYIAQKIVKTEFEVDTNNNTVNPIRGLYDVVVSPWLTDSDAWFLMTDLDADEGIIFQSRWKPTIEKDTAFDTLNMKFITYARWGVGVVNPRCAYGSPGA